MVSFDIMLSDHRLLNFNGMKLWQVITDLYVKFTYKYETETNSAVANMPVVLIKVYIWIYIYGLIARGAIIQHFLET